MGLIAIAIVGGLVVRALTAPAPAPSTEIVVAPPVQKVDATPSTPTTEAPVSPVEHAVKADTHTEPRVHARPTTLSVRSDVDALVYVDGKYAGESPLVHFATTPGKHTVRVEPQGAGLRLLPREENVTLTAGEDRPLKIDLE
jgi:hypothetical protein